MLYKFLTHINYIVLNIKKKIYMYKFFLIENKLISISISIFNALFYFCFKLKIVLIDINEKLINFKIFFMLNYNVFPIFYFTT